MKSINSRKALLATLGTVMVSGAMVSTNAQAEANPFGMTELSSGYMQVAEGSCGEGMKGKDKKKAKGEGSCGEGMKGKDKKKAKGEGSCGEGKCGGGM